MGGGGNATAPLPLNTPLRIQIHQTALCQAVCSVHSVFVEFLIISRNQAAVTCKAVESALGSSEPSYCSEIDLGINFTMCMNAG